MEIKGDKKFMVTEALIDTAREYFESRNAAPTKKSMLEALLKSNFVMPTEDPSFYTVDYLIKAINQKVALFTDLPHVPGYYVKTKKSYMYAFIEDNSDYYLGFEYHNLPKKKWLISVLYHLMPESGFFTYDKTPKVTGLEHFDKIEFENVFNYKRPRKTPQNLHEEAFKKLLKLKYDALIDSKKCDYTLRKYSTLAKNKDIKEALNNLLHIITTDWQKTTQGISSYMNARKKLVDELLSHNQSLLLEQELNDLIKTINKDFEKRKNHIIELDYSVTDNLENLNSIIQQIKQFKFSSLFSHANISKIESIGPLMKHLVLEKDYALFDKLLNKIRHSSAYNSDDIESAINELETLKNRYIDYLELKKTEVKSPKTGSISIEIDEKNSDEKNTEVMKMFLKNINDQIINNPLIADSVYNKKFSHAAKTSLSELHDVLAEGVFKGEGANLIKYNYNELEDEERDMVNQIKKEYFKQVQTLINQLKQRKEELNKDNIQMVTDANTKINEVIKQSEIRKSEIIQENIRAAETNITPFNILTPPVATQIPQTKTQEIVVTDEKINKSELGYNAQQNVMGMTSSRLSSQQKSQTIDFNDKRPVFVVKQKEYPTSIHSKYHPAIEEFIKANSNTKNTYAQLVAKLDKALETKNARGAVAGKITDILVTEGIIAFKYW